MRGDSKDNMWFDFSSRKMREKQEGRMKRERKQKEKREEIQRRKKLKGK